MLRTAKEEDSKRIDVLRKQTRDLHVKFKPELFKQYSSFDEEYTKLVINGEESDILVCEDEGKIISYMIVKKIIKPENQYCFERKYLLIEDFGVDETYQHKGIGTKLFGFCKEYAKEIGFEDIKLDVWAFNENAFKFYEKRGFKIERYYMDYVIDEK